MIFIIILLLLVGYMYGLYLWFEKAGEAGWKAFVPYFRISTWVKLTNKPKWFIIGSFVPVLNLFIYTHLLGETSDSYRRYDFWEHSLAILGGFFWLPYLGRSQELYHGPAGSNGGYEAPKKAKIREWADAIIFAVFAAYFIRTFVFEIYAIPTSSMEGTLRVGDVLVVSKFHYGSRIPNTPLAFPLVHHSFPAILGGGKSYLEWIKLPYKRLPAIEKVERNDMVVFNFPANDTTTREYDSALPYYDLVRRADAEGIPNPAKFIKEKYTILTRPVDKRENYIKRCVAIPNDVLEVRGGTLYINDEPAYEPENLQYTYIVTTNGTPISDEQFIKLDITEFYPIDGSNGVYEVFTNKTKAAALEALIQVNAVNIYYKNDPSDFIGSEYTFYPYSKDFVWNQDNYGPITIPSKGMTITLNKENYLLYERCIRVYENNTLEIKGGKAYVNGMEAREYTFKMDYYWMMGDNRHRSQDSRFWGFVPEDHIVGKAWFLVASFSKENSFLRLNRTFKGIHSNWAPKEEKFKN